MKSSFLTTIENQKNLDNNLKNKKEEKRSDIKVLNLDDFGSVKSKN